ncbi:UDP-glucose 4-epimerase GalE [Flavobacteriales bacterium]|nr:UDP-glucose 4-epimerase GalE [Flavobacteriales bacterium]
MRVLVTGGLGFIGSHTVVELIENGFEVVIVDNLSNSRAGVLEQITKITNKKVKFYNIDIVNKNDFDLVFKENKIDAIIHFAAFKSVAESMTKVVEYYENNIGSLVSVLSKMEEYEVEKMIFSSSCTVYGQPESLPVSEDSPVQEAESVYGTTKIMCEKIIKDFIKQKDAQKAMLLRYFNPVGAHESGLIGEITTGVPNYLFPYITQTVFGQREELKIFGSDYNTPDGTAIRDYIHVVDLAKAHVSSLKRIEESNSKIETINVGAGKGYSVMEVVKMFEKVLGKPINYKLVDRREGDIEKIYAVCDRANELLKWKTKHSLEDMVRSALKWEDNLNAGKIKL